MFIDPVFNKWITLHNIVRLFLYNCTIKSINSCSYNITVLSSVWCLYNITALSSIWCSYNITVLSSIWCSYNHYTIEYIMFIQYHNIYRVHVYNITTLLSIWCSYNVTVLLSIGCSCNITALLSIWCLYNITVLSSVYVHTISLHYWVYDVRTSIEYMMFLLVKSIKEWACTFQTVPAGAPGCITIVTLSTHLTCNTCCIVLTILKKKKYCQNSLTFWETEYISSK